MNIEGAVKIVKKDARTLEIKDVIEQKNTVWVWAQGSGAAFSGAYKVSLTTNEDSLLTYWTGAFNLPSVSRMFYAQRGNANYANQYLLADGSPRNSSDANNGYKLAFYASANPPYGDINARFDPPGSLRTIYGVNLMNTSTSYEGSAPPPIAWVNLETTCTQDVSEVLDVTYRLYFIFGESVSYENNMSTNITTHQHLLRYNSGLFRPFDQVTQQGTGFQPRNTFNRPYHPTHRPLDHRNPDFAYITYHAGNYQPNANSPYNWFFNNDFIINGGAYLEQQNHLYEGSIGPARRWPTGMTQTRDWDATPAPTTIHNQNELELGINFGREHWQNGRIINGFFAGRLSQTITDLNNGNQATIPQQCSLFIPLSSANNLISDGTTYNSPIQSIHNHSQVARRPGIDVDYLASGSSYLVANTTMDNWTGANNAPSYFNVRISKTGNTATGALAKYTFAKTLTYGFGNLGPDNDYAVEWYNGYYEVPWFAQTFRAGTNEWLTDIVDITIPGGHGLGTVYMNQFLDENNLINVDPTGLTIGHLYTGTYFNFDQTTDNRLDFVDIQQIAVDSNNNIWIADKGGGLKRIANPLKTGIANTMTNAVNNIPVGGETNCYGLAFAKDERLYALFDGGLAYTDDATQNDPSNITFTTDAFFSYTGISDSNWSTVVGIKADRYNPDEYHLALTQRIDDNNTAVVWYNASNTTSILGPIISTGTSSAITDWVWHVSDDGAAMTYGRPNYHSIITCSDNGTWRSSAGTVHDRYYYRKFFNDQSMGTGHYTTDTTSETWVGDQSDNLRKITHGGLAGTLYELYVDQPGYHSRWYTEGAMFKDKIHNVHYEISSNLNDNNTFQIGRLIVHSPPSGMPGRVKAHPIMQMHSRAVTTAPSSDPNAWDQNSDYGGYDGVNGYIWRRGTPWNQGVGNIGFNIAYNAFARTQGFLVPPNNILYCSLGGDTQRNVGDASSWLTDEEIKPGGGIAYAYKIGTQHRSIYNSTVYQDGKEQVGSPVNAFYWDDYRWNGTEWELNYCDELINTVETYTGPISANNAFRKGFDVENHFFTGRSYVECSNNFPSSGPEQWSSGDASFLFTIKPHNNKFGGNYAEHFIEWQNIVLFDVGDGTSNLRLNWKDWEYPGGGMYLSSNNSYTKVFTDVEATYPFNAHRPVLDDLGYEYRVVVTASGSQANVWVNGTHLGGHTMDGDLSTLFANANGKLKFMIGCQGYNIEYNGRFMPLNFFRGHANNIQLWNRKLSDSEIDNDYNTLNGKGVVSPFNNLKAVYDLNHELNESRTVHSNELEIIDGINLKFPEGPTDPSWQFGDYYTFAVCNGILKDESNQFDWNNRYFVNVFDFNYGNIKNPHGGTTISTSTPSANTHKVNFLRASPNQTINNNNYSGFFNGTFGEQHKVILPGETYWMSHGFTYSALPVGTGDFYYEATIAGANTNNNSHELGIFLTDSNFEAQLAQNGSRTWTQVADGPGIHLEQSNGLVDIYENATLQVNNATSWGANDIFRIERSSGQILYKKNNVTFHTSTTYTSDTIDWYPGTFTEDNGYWVVDGIRDIVPYAPKFVNHIMSYIPPNPIMYIGDSLTNDGFANDFFQQTNSKHAGNRIKINGVDAPVTLEAKPYSLMTNPDPGEVNVNSAGFIVFNPADVGATVTANVIISFLRA